MFYYTYKVVLLKGSLAGHYYFGQHRTSKLDDGYIGSGTKLVSYFKKYPRIEGVTYTRQILAFYADEEELNTAEKILVSDLYETDPLCLNLKAGGQQAKFSIECNKRNSERQKGKKLSPETKAKISSKLKGRKGRQWTVEQRKAKSEAQKGKPKGPSKLKGRQRPEIALSNSSRRWMNDGIRNFRISSDQVTEYLRKGFKPGRLR